MIALTASFLCSVALGARLTFPAFLPLMILGAVAATVFQGALAGAVALAALQTGYVCGMLLRAFAPSRQPRAAALRQAAARP